MKKVQRNWNDILEELNEKITSCNLNPTMLSRCSGVDYYASRRFLKNGVRNKTASSMKLCTFFNIELDKNLEMQNCELLPIIEAAEEVLDGTPIQAEFICRLIRSTKQYSINRKI